MARNNNRREPVMWGCHVHRTPRGIECWYCADQGELFPRSRHATDALPTLLPKSGY
jgi:hypothetical protein